MNEEGTIGTGAPVAGVGENTRALDITQAASQVGERARVAAALPTGAQRSLYNMERIRFRRALDRLRVPTTAPISDLQWLPTAGQAIEREPGETLAQQIWHAGHVSALLVVDPVVIAATQTGGVWLIGIGAVMLLAQTHAFGLDSHNSWPLFIILSGLIMLIRGVR